MNLVARAVDDDARMIAVAADSVAHIRVRPLTKIEMIVERILGDGPAVEQFIHHDEAHPVAQVQKLRRGRIVSGANGISAELPERFEAALPGAQGNRRAESAGVRVQADAFE